MRHRLSRIVSAALLLPMVAVIDVSVGPSASADPTTSPSPSPQTQQSGAPSAVAAGTNLGATTGDAASSPVAAAQALVAQASPDNTAADAVPTTPGGQVDATAVLTNLQAAVPKLHGSDRREAKHILDRPTAHGGDNLGYGAFVHLDPATAKLRATKHFEIHYVTRGTNAASAHQVDLTARTLEHVYATEVGHMGFRAPRSDANVSPKGTNNPNGLIDVYLANVGRYRIYGYCAADHESARTSSGYCVLDNTFSKKKFGKRSSPANALRVTAAHEFFHAIQYGYRNELQNWPWFAEGTAVWMEDRVYNHINDYRQYVPASPIRRPRTPFRSNAGLARYGAFTLFKYVTTHYHDSQFVKKMWNRVAKGSSPIHALTYELRHHHTSLRKSMRIFGVWNTLRARTYPERWAYRPVGWWHKLTLSKSHRRTKRLHVRIRPLATAPLHLRPGRSLRRHARVVIHVNAPNRKRYAPVVDVQIRRGHGRVHTVPFRLGKHGNATHSYTFNPHRVSSIVVTMGNARHTGHARKFWVSAHVR